MTSKSIMSLSSLMALALMTASTIGCSKPVHKGEKTFDKDLVGYWAPSSEQASSAGGSDVPPVIRIDSNGDLFFFNEEKGEFKKIGVIQADGAVVFSPGVLISNGSGPTSVVLAKIDINSIKAVGTGPESSESGSGEPVGNQKMVKDEIYFKRFTPSQKDEFDKALAARTQKKNPTSTDTGTVSGPSEEEESQVAGNEELEPSPRIPTTEWIEIDPKTWEAHSAIPDFMLRQ